MNDTILGIQDEKSARAVRNIFNGLGLPVPEEGEYRERSDGAGPLVLVSRYGFVVRVVLDGDVPPIQHPHFIRPLFKRAAGNRHLIIDPGYNLKEVLFDDYEKIERAFHRYKIECHDMKRNNIARVPGYPGYPVLIDIDMMYLSVPHAAVESLTRAASAAALQLGIGRPEPDPQIALYEPLRDILDRAWPEGAPAPNTEGIRDFKELCLGFKAEGLLRSDWEDPQHDYEGTWHIARLYDDRLKDYETWCDQNPQPLRLTA